ncbi:MAG TPA: helix-turn-helix domain-containing protein [Candidatus Saccharimonadales bacterium]|jgi:sugar-specific transcriptional regulator TrmB|nr:helix-turn-helix domain-containing protein [Candidatus Saccharimonadales bacterium]
MSQYMLLRQVGLSKTAIRCYESLVEKGPAEAVDLAKRLKQSPTNMYGVLNFLVKEGFVDKIKLTTQPGVFKARQLDKALLERYMRHRILLMPLFDELGILPSALSLRLRR